MYVFHVENVKLDIDINRSITQTLAPSLYVGLHVPIIG